ncbi:glycogen-binding domain-containing protein [Fodinibius sp. Rm-B-1B1-1]|uniref:glycogen-binding domain-containing protein n=1 Tax=Fodinibius alkaliphilus TaxID=3140241 RepID=UPI003159DBC2
MRIVLVTVILLLSISNELLAQEWDTVFSVDSRLGYSTNTYLNPYYGEWDRSQNVGYGVLSGIVQTSWIDDQNILDLTGLAVVEPLFEGSGTWKGGLGLVSYRRKITPSFSVGVEGGGSHFNSSFSRSMGWIQPKLVWSVTPFSQLKLKAGSNFRSYQDYMVDSVSTTVSDRSELYAIEFETWPSFNWKFSSGLYGNMDAFPAIQEGFSSFIALSRLFREGAKIRVKMGLEQYQNEQTVTTGGGGGFPPVGGGPQETTETIRETNRIFKLGVEGSVPVNKRITAFVHAQGLRYNATTTDQNINDVQISGGIRLSLQPKSRKNKGKASPDWNSNSNNKQQVEIKYSGDGRLYVVGDFNNWNRPGIPLVNVEKDFYRASIELPPGSYEYKILKIEQGEENWIDFAEGTYTVDDGFGGQNALLLVQ